MRRADEPQQFRHHRVAAADKEDRKSEPTEARGVNR